MCDPTGGVATLALLTVASGAMQYQQQKQDSKFMRNQLEAEGQLNAEATNDQIGQIKNQATIDISERAKAALQERARLRVAAGEFGVGGVSPDISEKRSMFAEGTDISTIDSNHRAARKQAVLEGRGAQARTLTGIYQNRAPDALASALTIGANVAGIKAGQPTAPKKPTTSKYDDGLGGYD